MSLDLRQIQSIYLNSLSLLFLDEHRLFSCPAALYLPFCGQKIRVMTRLMINAMTNPMTDSKTNPCFLFDSHQLGIIVHTIIHLAILE